MLKKIIGAGAVVGSLLVLSGAVMAYHHSTGGSSFNTAKITNYATADSETGFNTQDNSAAVSEASDSIAGAGAVGGSKTITTSAATANATGYVIANVNVCGTCNRHEVYSMNSATISNGAETVALTGGNSQNNSASVYRAHDSAAIAADVSLHGGTQSISSGTASSGSTAWVAVNVH